MKGNNPHTASEYSGQDFKELLEYESNPFDTTKKRAADIMRIFFERNVPLLPVVSRDNHLFGIITKPALTAAMSDIDNFDSVKIDAFVMKVAQKMEFEEVVALIGNEKLFPVINIFGEEKGNWSRIDLLEASDVTRMKKNDVDLEVQQNKEDAALEWMIYMILEHIPRPLYAVNQNGGTIFYNGLFEQLVCERLDVFEPDVEYIEKSFADVTLNDYFEGSLGEYCFYNKELDLYYEKVPMKNEGKSVGYLIYCSRGLKEHADAGTNQDAVSFDEKVEAYERKLIVDALHASGNELTITAEMLDISRSALQKKIKKLGINT
ncbi:MAG TPA: helix-turn-helix domain-containing protein [Spirochaetota bacterium]|nr:helix-turn-helix domain-containing protein [Spirochaetota bacterium]